MIQVQPGMMQIFHFLIFIPDDFSDFGFEFYPFQPGYHDQSECTGVLQCPDDWFHHRKIRDVEPGNDNAFFPCTLDHFPCANGGGVLHFIRKLVLKLNRIYNLKILECSN